MQYVSVEGFLGVSRITGPAHNLLQIRLGGGLQGTPVCEEIGPVSHGSSRELRKSEVVEAVLRGIKRANRELRTAYVVTHIRYVANDTKPESAYAELAGKIVEHLENGGDFIVGQRSSAP